MRAWPKKKNVGLTMRNKGFNFFFPQSYMDLGCSYCYTLYVSTWNVWISKEKCGLHPEEYRLYLFIFFGRNKNVLFINYQELHHCNLFWFFNKGIPVRNFKKTFSHMLIGGVASLSNNSHIKLWYSNLINCVMCGDVWWVLHQVFIGLN